MPIYEYICDVCETEFEEFLHHPDRERDIHCPECKSTSVERRFSVFGFSSGNPSAPVASSSSSCATCASKNCASCR